MAHEATVAALRQAIDALLQAESIALVDMQWGRRGKRWGLTLFIEKETGVTLDDCERISEQLGELIDAENLIEHAYILEVSSPGLDRPVRSLGEYQRFQGRLVKLTTREPIRGRSTIVGRIMGVEGETVLVEVERAGVVPIPFAHITHARLEVEF